MKNKYSRPQPSIERHIRWLIIVSIGALLMVAFILLDYAVVHWISTEYDRSLIAKARALVTLTKQFGEYGEIELEFADEFMPEFEAEVDPEYFQLWFEDGSVLERSNSLHPENLPQSNQNKEGTKLFDLTLPDLRKGRAVEIIFFPQIEDKEDIPVEELPKQPLMRLVVARERESLDRLITIIHASLFFSIAFMIFIIAYLVKLSVRKGLRPLNEMGKQLKALDVKQLDSRLTVSNPPHELQSVITQFNELLQRLELSFQRERRFTSDVAHELRTPVAELRSLAEVATRWADDKPSLIRFFTDALDISRNLQLIINNLLALARCDNGKLKLDYQTIHAAKLLEAAWLRVRHEARSRQLKFKLQGDLEFYCHSCLNELELIFNNLFSNAVAYAKESTEVVALIDVNENIASITVANIARQLEQKDLEVMFDRLWRKDKARTEQHHAGLGLSLVEIYAEVLKLSVHVDLTEESTFSITIKGLRSGLHDSNAKSPG